MFIFLLPNLAAGTLLRWPVELSLAVTGSCRCNRESYPTLGATFAWFTTKAVLLERHLFTCRGKPYRFPF